MPREPELLAIGVQYHQSGQFDRAQEMYRQILAAEPQNVDVLNLLGAACINLGQLDAAATHLAEALRLNPNHPAALDNQGVLLANQRRFAEAVTAFARAATLNPQHAQTQLNLANALLRNGQTSEAIDAFRRVIRLSPDSLRAHTELAQALLQQQRIGEAVGHLNEIVRLKPQDPKAHFDLAAVLAQCGERDAAIAHYRETLRFKPDSAEACVNLANLLVDKGSLDEGVSLLEHAVQMRPQFAEAHVNLGSALTKQRKFAAARSALETAVRLKPELPEAHNDLGIVQAEEGDFATAVESYRRAIALRPADADAIYNLGIAQLKQKMIASAIENFEHALELRPSYAEAHHNLAAALLLSENFSEGFAEYEWRFKARDFPGIRLRWPRWDLSDLAGRTIVLSAEQGLGDTLQFIRYAAVIKARGARVIVDCPAVLHSLLARTPGVDAWTSPEQPPVEADCCVPLMSLPHLLGTTLATIPAEIPYVFAEADRVAHWQQKLADLSGFKIGIVWQGNQNCPGDQFRSIPLSAFAPLADLAGVRLVSLQKGPGVEQLADVADRWRIADFGETFDATGGAFMDTAAVMKNLDLVITSDTATAHLAGALGVPVWVALCASPDWRWFVEREDSPWYPTMRLFRQSGWSHWSDVFQQMAADLKPLLASR